MDAPFLHLPALEVHHASKGRHIQMQKTFTTDEGPTRYVNKNICCGMITPGRTDEDTTNAEKSASGAMIAPRPFDDRTYNLKIVAGRANNVAMTVDKISCSGTIEEVTTTALLTIQSAYRTSNTENLK